MKKLYLCLILLISFIMIGTGCIKKAPADGAETRTFQAIVLQSDRGLLVRPDKDSDEFKSSDQISVSLPEDILVTDKDGKKTGRKEIHQGEIIEIVYNGIIMESYPAQISAQCIQVMDTMGADGFLALIEDIYNEDTGLNSDIDTIVVDTTDLQELSDLEIQKLLMSIEEKYSIKAREGTYEELVEEGFIDDEKLYFETGILIKIIAPVYYEKEKKITCGISKWRSGLGAIGSDEVIAQFQDNSWVIKKKGVWIS